MGLGLGDFLDLTPFAWIGIKSRFIEYQNRSDQERWEMVRWHAFRVACPPEGKKVGNKTMVSPMDFIVFPWETKPEAVNTGKKDEEAFKRAVELYK